MGNVLDDVCLNKEVRPALKTQQSRDITRLIDGGDLYLRPDAESGDVQK